MQVSDYIAIAKMVTDLGMVVLPLVLRRNEDGSVTPVVLLPLSEETAETNAAVLKAILEANAQPMKPPGAASTESGVEMKIS